MTFKEINFMFKVETSFFNSRKVVSKKSLGFEKLVYCELNQTNKFNYINRSQKVIFHLAVLASDPPFIQMWRIIHELMNKESLAKSRTFFSEHKLRRKLSLKTSNKLLRVK